MEIRTGGMSVSGQSHSLWNAQPRASSGAFVCGTNPRARNCPRCGRPKTLLPQCVLSPASAGLLFLKTKAGISRRCDSRRGTTTSAPACAPLVRSSHAQAPAVLDRSHTLPQGDGHAWPAFAGGAVGSECGLVVLNLGDEDHSAV